ncbi:MAG: nucleotidyltransferase domain-containing protein [Chloroflexota bacterium]|nr:nucleotidyltransferase domain-containing protein [Chloroflexota bacterium]
MDEIISARLHITDEQIAAFCQKWQIVRFELFGSALRDDFDDQSDVDVLVTFAQEPRWRFADLLDIEDALKAMFHRNVDLVERPLLEQSPNWIRRRAILETARPVYASA